MSVKETIEKTLANAGYEDRLGKCFGTCFHSCGMPRDEGVTVQPDYSPVDGAHVIRVTATEVASYVCHYPSNNFDWHLITRESYDSPEKMLQIVAERIELPTGCW
jgi:hypothetical protein